MSTENTATGDTESQGIKKPKHRSPNHPMFGLAKAIEHTAKIFEAFGSHEAPINLAHKQCGYKEGSAIGDQCIAALKSYGLVDVTGIGTKRKVTVSKDGQRIVRNAPDRAELVKKAALAPPIHKEILDHYGDKGLPANPLLRTYLVWDRADGQRFNEDTVDAFIERFRGALSYAGIGSDDIIGEESNSLAAEDEKPAPKLGDFVQWTSNGTDQFEVPRKLAQIEGEWAFVEGHPTGVPMAELTVQDHPIQQTAQQHRGSGTPPANPLYKPPGQGGRQLPESPDGAYISFPLSGGNVLEIRLSKRVSPKDFERIKTLVELSEASLVEESE